MVIRQAVAAYEEGEADLRGAVTYASCTRGWKAMSRVRTPAAAARTAASREPQLRRYRG